MQQVENKFVEMERAASIKQMATDANWQASKQEMSQNTDSDVDQATAKFTQLELHERAQQELAQQIIAAAKQEFEDEKRVIDGTADSLHQTVAAVQRLSVLEDQVKQFQNMDHSAAMESLNTRVDTLEAVGAGAGVTVSAAKGVSAGKVDTTEDLSWQCGGVARFEARLRGLCRHEEHRHVLVSGRNCEEQRSEVVRPWGQSDKGPSCCVACTERIDRWHGHNDCHVSWVRRRV